MLGSGKHKESKLRDSGSTAPATVLAAKQGHIGMGTAGQAYGGQNSTINWHLTLQVTPAGEAPFEVKISERYPISSIGPGVGNTVQVLYDPADHGKVSVDHSAGAAIDGFIGGMSDSTKAALQAAGAGDATADLMAQAAADPVALLRKMQASPSALADEFRAQLAPPQGGTPAGATAMDPVAELERLADLRDRGVLTNEEFAVQKKRILSE